MKPSQSNLASLLTSILFIIGALFLFGISLLMGVTALASFFSGADVKAEQTIFLAAFAFEGIVLLIAAFFSIQKYLRKPAMDREASLPLSRGWIILLVLIASASILIGYPISSIKTIDWLILPLLTIPAIVIPLGVLVAFGTWKLPLGTHWQTWSILGIAMTLSPVLLLMLEVIAAIVVFIGIIAYVMTQPQLVYELQGLSQQVMILGPDSEAARKLLLPILAKPGALVSVLIYISILVPAIEEIIKPLGVWLFVSKLESPAQGFTLGALSGAGYALIETIGVSGQQTDQWASVLFSRIGTGLLHITTSALMGTAILLAWHQRRYLRLVDTYLLAVLLHGLWNTFAIIFTFATLPEVSAQATGLTKFQPAMLIAMIVEAIVLFTILVMTNRKMRKTVLPPPIEPTLPPPSESADLSQGMGSG